MRFKIEEVVELRAMADKVEEDASNNTFKPKEIVELCEYVKHFTECFDATITDDESVLYDAICKLYPNGFGRHDKARECIKMLRERYENNGRK